MNDVLAIHLRTAGPRSYEHAILDLAAVVVSEDGETVAEIHRMLQPCDWLSYRPHAMAAAEVSYGALRQGSPYYVGVEEVLAFVDAQAGFAYAWAFGGETVKAFLATSAKKANCVYGVDRVACVSQLLTVARAVGAIRTNGVSETSLLSELDMSPPGPEVNSRDAAMTAAIAVHRTVSLLRDHFGAATVPSREIAALPALGVPA